MQVSLKPLLIGISLLTLIGCERREDATSHTTAETTPIAPTVAALPQQLTDARRVVFLGDSLTAGYGLDPAEAFPSLIERQLASEGMSVTVVNAGVSGDTTAGGLRRLDWILKQKPEVLVVCLGGNDGLRNLDVAASKENLRKIIVGAQAAGSRVLLLGMMIPTNYGPEYREKFASIFPALATEFGIPLVPFALEGVGGVPELNLPDGIHPTARGHEIVASNVIGPLRDLLKASQQK